MELSFSSAESQFAFGVLATCSTWGNPRRLRTRSKRSHAVGGASRREGFTLRYVLKRLPFSQKERLAPRENFRVAIFVDPTFP
ncbi:hypothetical protein [Nostoc sp.]|uniref:hypothetical protein n=1 Tax=Nostoc sp. TaxID=1180 RepID=UPI002FF91531